MNILKQLAILLSQKPESEEIPYEIITFQSLEFTPCTTGEMAQKTGGATKCSPHQ